MIAPHVRSTLLSSVALAFFGCTGNEIDTPGQRTETQARTTPMHMADKTTIVRVPRVLPPIDAEAPTAYQTATFALG
ncbi:MAG: hypothetical protein ABIP94_04305 [Planctomycetota bacterium]